MELTTNGGDILIKAPLLYMSTYCQGSNLEFSFACKFKCFQIHSSYARLFSWGVSGALRGSIHVSITSNTSHTNCNVPYII